MAPPKPKPRTELARAAAAAAKWAYATPGQSDKQHAAAMRNYEYIQQRLAETGRQPGYSSDLTPEEQAIGTKWRAKREAAPIPKPTAKYRPGDPEWSSDAVLSDAEIKKAAKVFTGPKKGAGPRILKELERQGFAPPKSEAEAQSQVKQLAKKLTTSQRAGVTAALKNPLDVRGNADLIGAPAARKLRDEAARNAPPPPPGPGWGGAVAHAADWATPDTVQHAATKAAGIVPFSGSGPVQNLKELTASFAMAPAAIAETIYHDVTNPGQFLLPKMAKEMLVGWGQGIEAATPLPADLRKTISDVAHGRWNDLSADAKKDFARMSEEWTQRPFSAILNLYPAASGALRVAEMPRLVRNIARANPGMSRTAVANAARRESYRPGRLEAEGIKGGIPRRILTGKIEVDGDTLGTFKAPARGWSRSPVTRKIQKGYDKFSRGDGPIAAENIPGMGRFTETRRAAVALRRKRTMAWERERVRALRQMKPVEDYIRQSGLGTKAKNALLGRLDENRSRLAETFYGPQGPSGVDPSVTLRAVGEDISAIAHDGGLDIPTTTLEKIDKQLATLDRAMGRMGIQVNIGQGLWAEAQNVMREAGYSNPQIAAEMERMASRARVWARRGENRDPNEWLSSPDGRNIASFVHGTPEEMADAAQTLYQKVFPGEDPPAHIPKVRFDPKKVAARVKSKAKPRKGTATGIPDTPDLFTNVDGKRYKIAGNVTPEDWVERVNAVIPDVAGQEHLARWYEHYVPMFRRAFGKDADAIMRGFAVSQANASPASGLSSVLRVMDALREGREVGKKGFGSVVSESIATAARNGEITSGVAAKLSDFINSLEGRSTRTWMGNHPDAGAPAAVDVHAIRDRGFVDHKLATRMENVHGVKRGEDFIIEGTGTATGGKYERIAEWYQEITDHLNEIGHNGRKDWTPAQAQALGWSAIQMAHKVIPEGFAEAFARNTRAITFEATKGAGGLGADLTLKESRVVARAMVKEARALAKSIPGLYLVDAKVGVGGWSKGSNANITVRVMGSKEAVQQSLTTFAQAFDQEWVQATREISGKDSRATLLLDSPKFRDPEQVARFFEALNRIAPDLEGYMQYDQGGRPTIAIRTNSRAVSPKTSKAFVERHRKAVEQAEAETGIKVSADVRNIEMLTGGQHGEVAPIQTLPGGGRGRAALDDPRTAGVRSRLEAAIDSTRAGREEGAAAPSGVTLHQTAPTGDIRGAVQFLSTDSGRQVLYMAEHADPSTFGHEMFGHAADEMRREYPDNFAAVERHYGKTYENWTRDEHERFATEVERYFRSGKAPTPELEPIFAQAKRWLSQVYETIKELGRPINPETKALLDRYFGKEPLDFTPPKRLRRGLPDPHDHVAVDALVNETAGLLDRGVSVLASDPARRMRIAGNMKWIEQQVLPYVKDNPPLAAKVHDLFDQFAEVQKGESIFTPEQRTAIATRGKLLDKRARELDKMSNTLAAQPDEVAMHMAHDTFDALDNAETLDDLEAAVSDLKDAGRDINKRTRYGHEDDRLLSRQVRDIERALDPNRKVDKAARDDAIEALRDISNQMTQIYLDTFGEDLSPEAYARLVDSLKRRDSIIPTRLRELGLLDEGTGEGAYMPHFSIFDTLTEQIRGAVRLPAAGRARKNLTMNVRADKGVFAKDPNKLIRYQTGQLKVDPRALLSVYKNRLRFVETSLLRKQLKELSIEIPEDKNGNPRIPEGWYLIKTKGAIPERLRAIRDMNDKELDELVAAGEDFDSKLATEEGFTEMLDEYKESFLGKKGDKNTAGWKQSEVRMLPPEVVEQLVGKVFESTPGGAFQSVGGLLALGGRVSAIFQHPLGYLNANAAANAIMLGLANPTRMPYAIREFLKTPGALRRTDPHLYQDIATDTGDVAAEAGMRDFYVRSQSGLENAERLAGAGLRSYAGKLGDVADQPFRVAAWTGEARRMGYRRPEDWRALLDADEASNPKLAADRDEIAQRSRENMLDFNKLSPQEQTMARYLFIWPFVRAGMAWPVWMTKEYAGRMAATAQVASAQTAAYQGTGMQSVEQRYNAVLPAGERSMFDIADVPFAGGTTNMASINPVQPMTEKLIEINKLAHGDPRPLADALNPSFTAIATGVFGRKWDWNKIAETTIPGAKYIQAAGDPAERGAQKYTDRDSYWDYIRRREIRFAPEDVDPEKIRESAKREKDQADKRPTWEKATEADHTDVDKIVAAIKKKGGHITPEELAPIQQSIEAYHALDRAESEYAKDLGKPADDLTESEKVHATEQVVLHYWPKAGLMSAEDLAKLPDKARGGKPSKQGYRYMLRDLVQKKRSEFFKFGRDVGAIE